ncbi:MULTISPECIES: ComEA family DNA-binding protein [unclassified Methylophaga]|jgi:competence protein ComEA|uniref:ComEA family DNA-binding protein n=1 Tax=unclassified Methylophaga TaxID=2629249 RepID=UPI00259D0E4F|nr:MULTISPECIES: helix-hairpin-helix domain-containing protein [unclassified Methylophaga]|tara:strand:+ start:9815 stop:10084 length:270 start_codon:yes stop_codon:yes gene_type:complete
MLRKSFFALVLSFFLSTSLAYAADKIDLNTATSEELQMLNGVGPSTADAIIEYRDAHGKFKTVDELTNVKGIGDKKLEKLSNDLTVSQN